MSAIVARWDIDHTLIENHGVNKETYALAFMLLTGREAEHRARTDGRTEPEIMRDMPSMPTLPSNSALVESYWPVAITRGIDVTAPLPYHCR